MDRKAKLDQISPNILALIYRKDTHPSHPLYPSENKNIPHVTHKENNVCLQIIHKITTSLYFFQFTRSRNNHTKSNLCTHSPVTSNPPPLDFGSFSVVRPCLHTGDSGTGSCELSFIANKCFITDNAGPPLCYRLNVLYNLKEV